MIKISILLCVIHLLYYAYFQVISDFQRMGMIINTPNIEIAKLRTKFKVNIHTFQRNTNHYGFAWFKTIYLNENLLKPKSRSKDRYKRLYWTFHHEYYHLAHHHKAWVLIMRFFFALTPLLLIWNWIPFTIVYIGWAYGMYWIKEIFEKNANIYAKKQMQE